MIVQRGQIWLINFDPSFGHEYRKVRPGLVVEGSEFIGFGSLVTVVPISSVVEKRTELDVSISASRMNRLMVDSIIKTRQISTFDKRRLIKYIGACEESVLQSVNASLRRYLDLS